MGSLKRYMFPGFADRARKVEIARRAVQEREEDLLLESLHVEQEGRRFTVEYYRSRRIVLKPETESYLLEAGDDGVVYSKTSWDRTDVLTFSREDQELFNSVTRGRVIGGIKR